MRWVVKYYIVYINLSCHKGNLYLKMERRANNMTNPELILKMIEMLLAERDKNNQLQSELEKKKKSEG